MIPDYTLVLGVDAKHFQQLKMVIPTWKKHKKSLFEKRWVVFHDNSIGGLEVLHLLRSYGVQDYFLCPWPPEGVEYEGDPNSKWTRPQREMMLSGFIHVAAEHVKTPYWLKIDTDTTASGMNEWIEPSWFEHDPAIISQKWAYTKPANQMLLLDKWVEDNPKELEYWHKHPSLNLVPNEGSSMVKHQRIISWCGFFNTEFSKLCAKACRDTCGNGKLPCPSQDGVMWYLAKRGNFGIKRVNFKSLGWKHRSSMKGIREAVEEAML